MKQVLLMNEKEIAEACREWVERRFPDRLSGGGDHIAFEVVVTPAVWDTPDSIPVEGMSTTYVRVSARQIQDPVKGKE